MIAYLVSAATLGVISILLALGLNLQWGAAGDLNLSYYAFVALGAYMTAVFNLGPAKPQLGTHYILGWDLPFFVALALAVAVCAAVGAIVGIALVRKLEGFYLATGAVSASLILYQISSQSLYPFNGAVGVFGIGQPLNTYLKLGPQGYAAVLLGIAVVFLVLVFILVEFIRRSPFGRALNLVREDPLSATSFGYNVYLLRVRAFVVASAIAGLGGGLLIAYVTAFNPSGWSSQEVVTLLAAIVLGGSGNNWGVLVGGALILGILPQTLLELPGMSSDPTVVAPLRDLIDGLVLIAIIWFRPRGFIPQRLLRAPKRAGLEDAGTAMAAYGATTVAAAESDGNG
jgi:branched-chain amino acid transport system permease protein